MCRLVDRMYLQTKTLALVLSDVFQLVYGLCQCNKRCVPLVCMRDISINVSEMTPFLRFEYVLLLRAISGHSTKVFDFNSIYKINFCISAGVFQLKYSVFPNKNTYQCKKKNKQIVAERFAFECILGFFANKFWWNFYGWLVVAIELVWKWMQVWIEVLRIHKFTTVNISKLLEMKATS